MVYQQVVPIEAVNETDYVLDQAGHQLTEMTSDGTNLNWAHTNVWADGQLIANYSSSTDSNGNPNGTLQFLLNDWLGTRRAMTDYAGLRQQSCASLPFGDGETCASTPTEHLFTGKERDAETQNDYFGARYYASTMGRFLSPDWSKNPQGVPYADFTNPQTLNLYQYMRDNPLGGVDPDGHLPTLLDKEFAAQVAAAGIQVPVLPAQQQGQYTVTLNSRAANIPGGKALHAMGADHEWITTSDGQAVGMGTAKNGGQIPDKGGQSSPDKPGDPTQLIDEHGDTPTSTRTYTNVDKGAMDSYLTPGKSTGAWIPGFNDCNTWAEGAIYLSAPHDAYDRNTDQFVHNAVVYADGSIHVVPPQPQQ